MDCQKESLALAPGRIFAELEKPMGYLAAGAEGRAVRVMMAHASLGVIMNIDRCLLLSRDLKGWLEWPMVAGGEARAVEIE